MKAANKRTEYMRRFRSKDTVRAAYYNLKYNCYRRKGRDFFELSMEEFREFCYQTNYINNKGIVVNCAHIDRIDETMGYFIGNIRVIPSQVNSGRNGRTLKYYYNEEEKKMVFFYEKNTPTEKEFLF